jgi:drug/metabolite transporter (DMT)-like permease
MITSRGKLARRQPMKASQMVGIVALVLGVVLLGVAYQSSNAPLDQISSIVTGRYTDRTMWYLIGGIGLALAGGFLTIFGRRS